MANGKLPSYLASATPNPVTNRAPWYKTTAQTYAGIMLWFVFWDNFPIGAGLEKGLAVGLLSLIAAALVCHFLFYLVPGMLGMQTGLPLYIVGTSTYGAKGGFLMPGVLMGLLQFGWLAVNGYFTGELLVSPFIENAKGSMPHMVVASGWIILGAFVGVKGIQYVARVATFLPLIPLAILVILFAMTAGGIGNFDTQALVKAGEEAVPPLTTFGILALIGTYVVGFFATAGAAGTDIASSNRNAKDVHLGGLVGIALATVFAAGVAMLIVAGAYGSKMVEAGGAMKPTALMEAIMGSKQTAGIFMYLLAIAAFPAACFSSLIAANSFKATMPKVRPLYSCGLGAIIAIVLAVTGWVGKAIMVFTVIGASFGPVCGAMMADYLLAGRKWPGPRAGFNLAGWISWVVGFAVGAVEFIAMIPGLEGLAGKVPCPPVAAFIVGFVLYLILAKVGLQSRTLQMPAAEAPQGA
jgi:cytosine permease